MRELGKNIKLVHGSSPGHFGILGGPKRVAYSFVVPQFQSALARLCALDFGQAEELRQAPAAAQVSITLQEFHERATQT
jgi:hypothetical protein